MKKKYLVYGLAGFLTLFAGGALINGQVEQQNAARIAGGAGPDASVGKSIDNTFGSSIAPVEPMPTIAPIPVATTTPAIKRKPQARSLAPVASQSLEQAFPVQEGAPSKRGSRQSRSENARPRASEPSMPRPAPVTREPEQGGQVWVNTKSKGHVYHMPGMRWYGKTKAGYFTTEEQAKKDGYRQAER